MNAHQGDQEGEAQRRKKKNTYIKNDLNLDSGYNAIDDNNRLMTSSQPYISLEYLPICN